MLAPLLLASCLLARCATPCPSPARPPNAPRAKGTPFRSSVDAMEASTQWKVAQTTSAGPEPTRRAGKGLGELGSGCSGSKSTPRARAQSPSAKTLVRLDHL